VESNGARYIGERDGIIYFRADDGPFISLYSFACTPENVRLALKNVREPTEPFEEAFESW
jgi:hypothetical protein